MKTYQITFTETRSVTVVIEAEDAVHAEEYFISQHEDGEWDEYFHANANMKIVEETDNQKETT